MENLNKSNKSSENSFLEKVREFLITEDVELANVQKRLDQIAENRDKFLMEIEHMLNWEEN